MTLTNAIIAINVIAYLWEVTTGGPSVDHGDLYGPYVMQRGEWWRIVTSAFLHGGIAHIALNMVALYQVGNAVEALFGKGRFLVLYVAALVGSGLAVLYFNYNVPTLGASGAIFGLFGALVAVGLRLGSRGRLLIGQVLPIIMINLVFTFTFPGISAAGHVGGLITGFLAGLVLFMVPSRRRDAAYSHVAEPNVETIDQPPEAAAHEEAGAPALERRDPRE